MYLQVVSMFYASTQKADTRIEESAKMGFTFYIEKYSDGVFDGAEDRED